MRQPTSPQHASPALLWLSLLYVLLIAYASLFPLDWHPPLVWSNPLTHPWPRSDSRSDVLVNVLAYMPLGLFLALSWRRFGRLFSATLALLAGFGLSCGMEFLQEALPGRVSSIADIVHNTLGTLLGVALAQAVSQDTLSGTWLRQWRARLVVPGTLPSMALIALVLWVAAELFPFVPSPDLTTIKHGVRPLVETLLHPGTFAWWKACGDVFELFGIGMLARSILRESSIPWVGMLIVGVTLLKVVVVYQVLSLEFFLAALVSLLLMTMLGWQSQRTRLGIALASIVASLVVDELRRGGTDHLYGFNWIPFSTQIGRLAGFNGLLVTLWITVSVAVAARLLAQQAAVREGLVRLLGGCALFGLWFALEWHQQSLPGRVPDITNPLVGLVVWWLVWLVPARRAAQARVNR